MLKPEVCCARTVVVGLLAVIVPLLSGCGDSKQLSRSKAMDLVPSCGNFNHSSTRMILTSQNVRWAYENYRITHEFEVDLESAGLLKIENLASGTAVSLTAKGQEESKSWNPRQVASDSPQLNWMHYYVPIATRQLIQVTGISATPEGADVEFSWKWAPVYPATDEHLQKYGLELSGLVHKSSVRFKLYDDGWRCVSAVRE